MTTEDPAVTINPTDGSASHPIDVSHHVSLGQSSYAAYWNDGDISKLANAVTAFRFALSQARDGSQERLRAQIGLVDALRVQVDEGIGGDENREESLSLAEAAVMTATSFPSLYPEAVRTLGEVLLDRSRRPETERLQRAVDSFRHLVDLTATSPPDLAVRALALYAQSLNVQWRETTGDATLMELANSIVDRGIHMHGDAVGAPDPYLGHAFMGARWSRYVMTSDVNGLTEAIEMAKLLIRSVPPESPWLLVLWNNLGNLYGDKGLLGGETGRDDAGENLQLQLHAYSEVVKRVRSDHSYAPLYRGNYAAALYMRFVSKSNIQDLNEAIAITRAVVSQMAETDQARYTAVSNLAELLVVSYGQSGDLAALDEAVALQLDSSNEVAPTLRQMGLWQLGKAYHTRYIAHGRMADLERAISLQEKALLCITGPYSHVTEVSILMAESLLDRFNQNAVTDDLERAISVLQSALEEPEKVFQGSVYSLLGHAFLKKGTMAKDVRDIEESIRCQRKALDLFPEAHQERSISYHRLGLAEYRAFLIDGRTSAIPNSIAAFRDALSDLPTDHPNRATYLLDLATCQLDGIDTAQLEQIAEILKILEEASLHPQSWPADRYAAAALWARTAHRAGHFETALHAYRLAISILPQVAWLGLEDELRLQRLSHQPPDISQDAAACAIALGRYDVAVEMIEASRSILWNTSQELRADLEKLREVAPEVALELAQTNAALAFRPGPVQEDEDPSSSESERRRIHRLATRRTELLRLTRSIPGLEQFLLPPSYETLRYASRQGPVVILVSSVYRCDALILQVNRDVTLVPLPKVTHRVVLAQVQLLQYALHTARDRKGQQFLDRTLLTLLRALWEHIGRPVLSAVSLSEQFYARELPRLWWCPTGAMTSLPLHACGPYNGADANITDFVVSSYTPTLSVLLRSQAQSIRQPHWAQSRILVVAQPETPDRPPLPCALEEARVLHSLLPSLCTFLIGVEGTVARVRHLLLNHNWLHISSHGSQDFRNPLQSSLALYDGELKLADLTRVHIQKADFAFLSACHSAKGTQLLPDEAMHLAAGMMFAGFRSVVATSWGIADKDAPAIAKAFYGRLIRDGKVPAVEDTAEALHFAVKRLRDSGVPSYRWVPFIHLGA